MPNLEGKRNVLDGFAALLGGASSIVVSDHRGVEAFELSKLYRRARECGARMRVVRSTLLLRALRDSPFAGVTPDLGGSNLVAFSYEDPGVAARLLQDFGRKNGGLRTKVAAIGGRVVPVDFLASLPTRVEAVGILLRLLREVTSARLLRLLRSLARGDLSPPRALPGDSL